MFKRISENFSINDKVLNLLEPKKPIIQGIICIKDPRGNVLLTKKNIITYRGRVWTLERLVDVNVLSKGNFNIPRTVYNKATATANYFSEDETMNYNDQGVDGFKACSDLNSEEYGKGENFDIRLFSVGDAGCQRDTDGTILPFNRLPPNTFDDDIYNYIPFKSSSYTDLDNSNNGGAYVRNNKGDDANGNGSWQFKKINLKKKTNTAVQCGYTYYVDKPEWHLSVAPNLNSLDDNEELKFSHEYAALRYDLIIDKTDLVYSKNSATTTTTSQTYEVPVINELGLFICNESYSPETIEMFSHVTFDSISFRDYKSLAVEYYLFV